MLLQGDCLTQLKNLEANSVDSIVTDPPYGLGFMGKQWDSLPPGQEVFEQCLRVLKPGGHLLCFGGSRTYHRMAVAVEDAGFEIRDQIIWVYGSGFPKSQNIGKAVDKIQGNEREEIFINPFADGATRKNAGFVTQYDIYNEYQKIPLNNGLKRETKGHSEWEGYGTALKPAHEPIVLARKPIEKGLSIAQNCLKWGVGAINVDGCRVATDEQDKKELEAKSSKTPTAKKAENVPFVEGIASKPNSQGRFPANLCHDGSDEVVGLFPFTHSAGKARKSSEGTHRGYHQGSTNFQGSPAMRFGDSGSAARFFYTAKAKKKERLTFNNHPTVKPVSLMQYLVRLITPAGGTCLDPFAGSGTTGLACMKEGRGYVLIEADSESLNIARRRLLSEIASQEWPLRNYNLL